MSDYTPYYPVWEDEPDHDTLVSAAALNHMEAGIIAANMPVEAGSSIEYENAWSGATPYTAGDVVIHNGIEYMAVNPSTGSTPPAVAGGTGAYPVVGYSTTLPGSPLDGQEHILVDSLTNPSYQWRFRYNAGSSSGYKWEFVGGAPKHVSVTASESTTGTTESDLTTAGPQVTGLRAGEYNVEYSAIVTSATAGTWPVLVARAIGGASGVSVALTVPVASYSSSLASAGKLTAAASDTIKLRYQAAFVGQTVSFGNRSLIVLPVRVS